MSNLPDVTEPSKKKLLNEKLVDYLPLWSLLVIILIAIFVTFSVENNLLGEKYFEVLGTVFNAILVPGVLLLAIVYFLWGIVGLFVYEKASTDRKRSKKKIKVGIVSFILSVLVWGIINVLTMSIGKPVIYLYPNEETDVTVQLDFDGELIADYPEFDNEISGWKVKAYPDGRLINYADGLEYSYIFWEGESQPGKKWDQSQGFVVAGSDTREFLRNKLSEMGLTPKEYNEFIVYWYPLMMNNPYNLITFAGKEYTDIAPLTITPTPDSVLRVFMVFKPLQRPAEVTPQIIEKFERIGFTVVEWGGSEI